MVHWRGLQGRTGRFPSGTGFPKGPQPSGLPGRGLRVLGALNGYSSFARTSDPPWSGRTPTGGCPATRLGTRRTLPRASADTRPQASWPGPTPTLWRCGAAGGALLLWIVWCCCASCGVLSAVLLVRCSLVDRFGRRHCERASLPWASAGRAATPWRSRRRCCWSSRCVCRATRGERRS